MPVRSPDLASRLRGLSPILLGAHVSIAGGVSKAPARGRRIGATAIQLFTKTPNQWREPVLAPSEITAFRSELAAAGLEAVVSHDSYLINLASPDRGLRERSIACLIGELTRCRALGIPLVVSHPGNFMDERSAGLDRNADGYTRCLEAVPGPTVLLETTAGAGTALGARFEELRALRAQIAPAVRDRVAFCADTCHLWAAGYDLVGQWDAVWEAWDRLLGLDRLHCLHLNDAASAVGSRLDRHAWVAEGTIGPEPFRRIMRDPRFADTIKIVETPKGDDAVRHDRRMLARLRAYARGPRRRAKRR